LNVENKFDARGYERIMEKTNIKRWTFFSDVAGEVDGAKKAGMGGYVVVREGNKPLDPEEEAKHHTLKHGFGDILNCLEVVGS
jgi:methionine salvage enolase-phosphatase E1